MDTEIDLVEPKWWGFNARFKLNDGMGELMDWVLVMGKKKIDPEIKQIYRTMLITRYEEDYQNTNYWDFDNYFCNIVKKLIRRYNAG